MAEKSKEMVPVATASTPPAKVYTSADFGGGLTVEGQQDTGSSLGRVVLFQGTAEEEAMYGEHKRGVFLDAIEKRELGTEITIMPIIAFATYAVWEEGSKRPASVWDDEKDVPPELLRWSGPDGKTPPTAQKSINVICLVNGEPWPYLIIFKRTGLEAFSKAIMPMESRRAAVGRVPGMYLLSSIADKNANGKPFQRLTAKGAIDPNSPKGTPMQLEPTAAQIELALTIKKARHAYKQRAAEHAKNEGAADTAGADDSFVPY